MAVRDIEKIEGLTDAAPDTDIRKEVAKTVNKVSEATRKALAPIMGHGVADKVVREDTNAKADLEKFKKEIMAKPERAELTNDIRKDIHDKVLKVLGEGIVFGADTIKFKDAAEAAKKFKEMNEKGEKESKAKTEGTAKAAEEPEVEPQITTADKSVYTGRQVAKAGLVVGSALTAGSLVAGASQAAFGGAALPWYARGISGFTNFWKGAWDIAWHKGVGNVVTNGIWNPLNTLAAKLGVTTGASANTAALAGLPAWMAPIGVGLGVAGGAYAGSKVVNWLGKKVGVKPTTIPIIGKIPFLGPILNSFLTVPPKAAWKGASKVASWGKQGFDWMWGKGKEAAEHREGATHFGIGALAGGTILAGLTGGSSLVLGLLGGHLARKGLKGKHLSDLIPAPFGIKKSEASGAPAHT